MIVVVNLIESGTRPRVRQLQQPLRCQGLNDTVDGASLQGLAAIPKPSHHLIHTVMALQLREGLKHQLTGAGGLKADIAQSLSRIHLMACDSEQFMFPLRSC